MFRQSLSVVFLGLALLGEASPTFDHPSLQPLWPRDSNTSNITTPSNPKANGQAACAKLAKKYPDVTFLPNTNNYTIESNADIWSTTCILSPVCAFSPKTAQDLAGGLTIIRNARSPFAVRSGGHMPVPGAQSTDNGVLIGMTHFNSKKLIQGGKVAQIGTGQRWVEVYGWIAPQGLGIAGGRYGEVGVGGLLLGGGISNFGNTIGWSFSTIVCYQAILPDSSIVEVTATSHPDLFWALRGGGNNFAIITRFDMETIPVSGAFTGIRAWGEDAIPQYLKAVADFITPGGGIDDPLTQINPTVSVFPDNGTFQALDIPFVAGNTTNPASLANITAVEPTLFDDLGPRPDWSSGSTELVAFNIIHERELFYSLGLKADPAIVQLAYETVLFSARDQLVNVKNSQVAVAYQPISHAWLQKAKDAGGDAIDIDPADGSFISVLIAYHWDSPADDAQMIAWGSSIVANLTQIATAKGLYYPHIYLNDAAAGQKPFALYGKGKSLPRLKSIQKKYDPRGFFKNLLGSGFKLDA